MNWQDYIAIGVVHLALIVVAKRVIRAYFGRGKHGCGSGCGSCASPPMSGIKSKNVLQIETRPIERRT
jgi:hypothetical protein